MASEQGVSAETPSHPAPASAEHLHLDEVTGEKVSKSERQFDQRISTMTELTPIVKRRTKQREIEARKAEKASKAAAVAHPGPRKRSLEKSLKATSIQTFVPKNILHYKLLANIRAEIL